jgi:hypothetical protein
MRLGQKMSEDVSITDLIAEARVQALRSFENPTHIRAMLTQLATALEVVTVPTENAYDVAYGLYGELDTLGVEGTDPRRKCFEAGWGAAIARLSVPVEPETQIKKRAEYKLVWGDGGERVSGDVEYFTRRMSVDHGDKVFKREITTTTSEWEEITEGGTYE